jgi:hypothetical protein
MKADRRWEELDRQISAQVEEFLHSPNLKIWRYQRTSRSIAHLFAELSDATKRPLCGQPIAEHAIAMVVTAARKGDCARCNQAAEAIFRRRAGRLASQ